MTNKDKLTALDIKLFAELFISHRRPSNSYESSLLPDTSFYTFEDALEATIDWLESNGLYKNDQLIRNEENYMKIRLYEVPNKNSSYGTETFLEEFKTNYIPRIGELIGFEGSDFHSYRITDVSYFYSKDCENGVAIDVLVVKSEI